MVQRATLTSGNATSMFRGRSRPPAVERWMVFARLVGLARRRPAPATEPHWDPDHLFSPTEGDPGRTAWGLRLSTRGRLIFVLAAVLIAYHYSLRTLLSTLGLDTPLAYLGLVPFMALGLALLRGVPGSDEPDIHDRQVDIIVGTPLMAAAVVIMLLLPGRMSTLFWYERIDLISMPLFVAGAICLAFGVRMLGRLRVSVAFLLLAWPVPYVFLLDRGMTKFTGTTLSALHAIVSKVHVATPVAGGDGSLFSLGSGAQQFTVSVASACSGVDGFVGFLLVGLAFLHLSRGRRWRKTAWLVFGLALVYTLNLGRLLLVFWVGSTWGQRVAIDGLHPYIGLVLFALGVALMALSAPLFGVQLEGPRRRLPRPTPRAAAAPQAPGGAVALSTAPRLRFAAIALATATLVAAFADQGLTRFSLVADSLGGTSIQSFLVQPVSLGGWQETKVAQYDWSKRFFGDDSTWIRYEYYGANKAAPVYADVVTTSSLSRLQAYGVQACYEFHGYGLHQPIDYDLGAGVKGTLLTFRNPQLSGEWNAIYWIWAVNTPQGHRYERVILLAPVLANYLPQPVPKKTTGKTTSAVYYGTPQLKETPRLLDASRAWLDHFAQSIVSARAHAPKVSSSTGVSAQG